MRKKNLAQLNEALSTLEP